MPTDNAPRPTQVKLHRNDGSLELHYSALGSFTLSGEYLRVYSPSAEVRGHGPGEEVLQHGKIAVKITKLEPMGHYALRITFDDGHDTGIYGWDFLHDLCVNREQHWQDYLDRLKQAGKHRDPGVQVVQLMDPGQN